MTFETGWTSAVTYKHTLMNHCWLGLQSESLWSAHSTPQGERRKGTEKKNKTKELWGTRSKSCNEPAGDEYLKMASWTPWSLQSQPPYPQPRFYCAQSIYLGTWITPVGFELYRQCSKDRDKRSVCSPKNQKQLDAWQSKCGMRVAVFHPWSCLCGCSPLTNHSVTCPFYHLHYINIKIQSWEPAWENKQSLGVQRASLQEEC